MDNVKANIPGYLKSFPPNFCIVHYIPFGKKREIGRAAGSAGDSPVSEPLKSAADHPVSPAKRRCANYLWSDYVSQRDSFEESGKKFSKWFRVVPRPRNVFWALTRGVSRQKTDDG